MSGSPRPYVERFVPLVIVGVLVAAVGVGAAAAAVAPGAVTSTAVTPTTLTPTTAAPTTVAPTTSTPPMLILPPAVPFHAPGGQVGPSAPVRAGPPGYWMLASDGGVFTFGSAGFHGSTGANHSAPPIVAMVPTPTGHGYWLAGADGAVFSFGDAGFHGSAAAGSGPSAPIVAMAGTPTGGGYWLFGRDGSVYRFGDATYWGQPPASAIHAPIVAAAATPDGQGYWVVAADGSVYPEGDAAVIGDASSVHLAHPVVGIAVTRSGQGYWLVASDGGIFTYGDAPFLGSTGAIRLNRPIVGMAGTIDSRGYWLFASDGGVFAYGDAPFLGSTGNIRLARPVVAARVPPPTHGTGTAVFFYPWYASQPHDGAWRHWDEGGHAPPDDVGSDYYPLRGAYSSLDQSVLSTQMADIASAGIGEVIVSWWGQGSFEDRALGGVVAAAAANGVTVGIHLEPYVGRTAQTVMSDYGYLAGIGITDIWVYQADLLPAAGLAAANHAFGGLRTMAESGDVGFVLSGGFAAWAASAGFRGVYLYDAINYEAGAFPAFCATAHAYGLVCAPVAAPGFSAVRATGATYGRQRDDGQTYDERWMGDVGADADLVAITSYNEWHEGTQIEPAIPKCLSATFCYQNYEGAWGTTGMAASYAYLTRTRYWASVLAASNP